MSLTVAFRNFGAPLQTWQRYTDEQINFWNSYGQNIWYHFTICLVTTAIHIIHPKYLISPYYLSSHKSYTHHILTISDITLFSVRSQQLYTPYTTLSDITLLSVRPQQLYTPYNHNIWYHLTICPVTTAINTIYPQYLISPYYLSGHNSYTHHTLTISDITLLSLQSQQLFKPYTHNIWYHLTICPVTTAIHTIHRLT